MNRLFARAIAFTLATMFVASAFAQAVYPSRPVRFIVGFPPGGSTDVASRTIAPALSERLGQQVIVENRPGAGGVVGLDLISKAQPDGYTIGIGVSGALTINTILMKLPYDPTKDFSPLSMFCVNPIALVAGANVAERTVPDLVARAKADGNKPLPFGTAGNGTAMHLAGELLKQTTGLPLEHVAYKGSAPAANDLVGGQIPLAVLDLASAKPLLASGRIRAIGVTSATRSATAPEIPTLAEAGVPGYDVKSWFGLLAPANTPPEIVRRLNADIVAVLQMPAVRERMLAAGLEPAPGTPDAFAETIRREIGTWAQVIKAAGIKAQ